MDGRLATISSEARQLLRKGGFSSTSEALRLAPTALAKELGIALPETLKLIAELRGEGDGTADLKGTRKAPPIIRNAFEMREETNGEIARAVTTLCKPLDKILNGGIPLKQLTEVCGAPGAGKTQLCIQVSVCASIPKDVGGVGGGALYLDTEGSFSPQRASDMAEALASHLEQQYQQLRGEKEESSIPPPTRDEILQNIHVCRAHDYGEQLAFVQCLPMFLRQHPNIRLVVIDSVAHHFRHDFVDMSQRTKLLSRHAHALNAAAHDFNVAVLVTNHMTTRSDQGLVPALGEHWYHGITNRIILTKSDDIVEWVHPRKVFPPMSVPLRRAEIVKAASLQNDSAEFVVVTIGMRSHRGARHQPSSSSSGSVSAAAPSTTAEETLKRLRMVDPST